MKSGWKKNNKWQVASAIFMMISLVWLTVSLPIINRAQAIAKAAQSAPGNTCDDNSCNPFGNTTEEKNPGNNTIAEEFLHEHQMTIEPNSVGIEYNKCTHPAIYVAFHGELISPPPEA